ncbi:MAG: putative lipid II flippase FtsW [Acidobacteria bacterium]|nr:MAG: putative lipid II flippase FtsW [Acidobacteriota bacterium]
MPKKLAYDRTLFVTTLALVTFGLVMVFSASALMSAEQFRSPYSFLLRQGAGAVLGLIAMVVLMRLDYRKLREPQVVYPLLCLTVLLLVAVFGLDRSHNTHRWIRMGPLSLQPSELAKPVLVLFLAFYLENKLRDVNEWLTLGPILVCLVALCGLVVFEPDLGTTVALALIAATMLYVAGLRWKWMGYGALVSLPILYVLVFHVHYRRERILAFLHPWQHARNVAFQIVQSLIALGSGGWAGVGLMNGRQKLFFLPEAHSDFIFAVVGEEFGWVGCTLIVLAFLIFLWRGLRIARRAPDSFGRLLAIGVTAMIVIQALINFSVVTSILPDKGIPLPFISYGGSSLLFSLAAVGMLLSVSQYTS